MKRLLFLLLLIPSASWSQPVESVPKAEPRHYSIVYTRQPRIEEALANWMHNYDGGINFRHTERDLVLDDLKKQPDSVKVLYRCTDVPRVCAVQDPRVSPDGTKVVYTVAHGTSLYPVNSWEKPTRATPPIEFKTQKYSCHIYDTVTGKDIEIESNGRMCTWFNESTLVFATNRDGIYTPLAYSLSQEPGHIYPANQIYIGDIEDGKLTNLFNLTPQSVGATNPEVMPDGRILWSEYNGFGLRGRKHTASNMIWINSVEPNGWDEKTILGAHGSTTFKTYPSLIGIADPNRRGEGSTSLKLLRVVRYLYGDVCAVVSYYRSNHRGARGMVLLFDCSDQPTEGFSKTSALVEADYKNDIWGGARYMRQVQLVTKWAQDQDLSWPKFHVNGKAMGKAGDPAPAPSTEGVMLITWSKGNSYEGTLIAGMNREAYGGEPTSKDLIALVKVTPANDPFDRKQILPIACEEDTYNCSDAQYLASRAELGMPPAPIRPKIVEGFTSTRLNIVNGNSCELFPIVGGSDPEQDKISFQGNGECATIKTLRAREVLMWKTPPTKFGFNYGRTFLADLYKDGSATMSLPAGIIYVFDGLDSTGKVVATDNTLHPAVAGETVTCHGCHDGHSVERAKQLGRSAVERFKDTLAYKDATPPGC